MKKLLAALVLTVVVSGCAAPQGSGLRLTVPARDGFDNGIALETTKPQQAEAIKQ